MVTHELKKLSVSYSDISKAKGLNAMEIEKL